MTKAPCSKLLSILEHELRENGLLARSHRVDTDPLINRDGVATDTRRLRRGDLFLAYRGVAQDSHDRLQQAVDLGAAALVIDDPAYFDRAATMGVPVLLTRSSRASWAFLASALHDHPERRLRFVGVTGTNGKTSTVWMLRALMSRMGHQILSIGTLGAFLGSEELPTNHTTPDPDALFGLFARALDKRVTTVAMEVSSIAVAQEKLGPVRFDAAAFTSFSRDHLDFHGTMESYLEQKRRVFRERLLPNARCCLSVGVAPLATPAIDPSHSTDVQVYGPANASFEDASHAVRYTIIRQSPVGTFVRISRHDKIYEGTVSYVGALAIENFVASLLLAERLVGSIPEPSLWLDLPAIPGRLESVRVNGKRAPSVFVDYAHTPDALEKTLEILRPLTLGRVVCVFGCGGDRDRGKRPEMGSIAERLADKVFVTSDNPRTEEPASILRAIRAGMTRDNHEIIQDRGTAIRAAIAGATADDVILIAGKGHETYEIVGTTKHHFDDREVARAALEALP